MRSVLIAFLCVTPTAHAGAKITIGSLTADGLELRNLSCDLEDGGVFSGVIIVGALAKQKTAFDKCAPEGAIFATTLTFKDGSAVAHVAAGGTSAQRACIERAVARVKVPLVGGCDAQLVVGKKPDVKVQRGKPPS